MLCTSIVIVYCSSIGIQIWCALRNGYHRNHISVCGIHTRDHSMEVKGGRESVSEGGREGECE